MSGWRRRVEQCSWIEYNELDQRLTEAGDHQAAFAAAAVHHRDLDSAHLDSRPKRDEAVVATAMS